jgi:molybdate transport system regulatory protein
LASPSRRETKRGTDGSDLKLQPVFRLSLEGERQHTVLDQTDALLLRYIGETKSLSSAARRAGISYRNAWDRVRKVEQTLGRRLVETKVGGSDGGGAALTPDGAALLREFRRLRRYLFDALDEREFWMQASYKLSARNRWKAKVAKVERGNVISQIKMVTVGPVALTSIISNEAVDDLGLEEGQEVEAIVKSTEVMVGKRSKESAEDSGH